MTCGILAVLAILRGLTGLLTVALRLPVLLAVSSARLAVLTRRRVSGRLLTVRIPLLVLLRRVGRRRGLLWLLWLLRLLVLRILLRRIGRWLPGRLLAP